MPPRKATSNDLRCFCGRKPLLATYGVDTRGQIYIHVKIYKQRRLFGEIVVTGGKVDIHCRECLRWHTVRITQPHTAKLEPTHRPPMVGAV